MKFLTDQMTKNPTSFAGWALLTLKMLGNVLGLGLALMICLPLVKVFWNIYVHIWHWISF